jgi:hypothetical protein
MAQPDRCGAAIRASEMLADKVKALAAHLYNALGQERQY